MANINILGSSDFTPDGSLYEKVTIAGSGDICGPLNCCSLSILGSGDIHGPVTCEGDITISGSGDINGPIWRCKSLKIFGSGDINGPVTCEGDITVSGSGNLNGPVDCKGDVTISGSGDIWGTVTCRSLRVSGSANIDKSVEAHKLEMSGSGDIKGDVSCEEAFITGSSSVSGLLNAENIVIELGDITIGEIGCTTLTVRDSSRSAPDIISKLFNKSEHKIFTCRVIEGDDITLENTVSKTVRGRNVRIGKGCEIESVEYSETLTVDETAEVKNRVKV